MEYISRHMYRHVYCPSINLAYYIIRFAMSCTSRCQHLWLSNFYTYKNLIPAILNLLLFDASKHNFDTVTGQDITNSKSLFIVSYKFCFVINFVSHMGSVQGASFAPIIPYFVGRNNSVGITTRYGLGDPGIESRWDARFSAPVRTGPGTHPASYTMGTGSFPGVKRPGRGVDHPPTT